MVRLVPMTPEEFAAFFERDVVDYAEEKVKAGNWAPEEAVLRSREEHEKLLREGVATPNHYLFSIWDDVAGRAVGEVWLMVEAGPRGATGFIYDLFVEEQSRGRGVATRAMQALEEQAAELGVRSLALHVFGHNLAARKLYEKLGYQITNVNMSKSVAAHKAV